MYADALSGCAHHQPDFALLVRVFLLWVVYNWRMEKQLSGKAMEKFPDYKTVSVSSVMKLMEVIRATA
jgi:hypothetical protein